MSEIAGMGDGVPDPEADAHKLGRELIRLGSALLEARTGSSNARATAVTLRRLADTLERNAPPTNYGNITRIGKGEPPDTGQGVPRRDHLKLHE